jgi:hypothetical protein
MANTKKTRAAARTALRAYVAAQGAAQANEPRAWQASDLITDLLLTFTPEQAAEILRRVERDNDADRNA